MERKSEVQAKKVIDVLIRWARKIFQAENKAQDEAKAEEAKKAEADKKPEEVKKTETPTLKPTPKVTKEPQEEQRETVQLKQVKKEVSDETKSCSHS